MESIGARTPKLPGSQMYRLMYRTERHIKRQLKRHMRVDRLGAKCTRSRSLNGSNKSARDVGQNDLSRAFVCPGKLIVEALLTLNQGAGVSSMGKGVVEVSTCDG